MVAYTTIWRSRPVPVLDGANGFNTMKLIKKICKECNKKTVFKGDYAIFCGWSMADEERWKNGIVYCPAYSIMVDIEIRKIDGNCKYRLEQMVLNQNET